MKIPFRVAITSALLFVLIPTVLVLGISAYLNGRFTVQDLSDQILAQTAARIEERAHATLGAATMPGTLVLNQLRAELDASGGVNSTAFPRLRVTIHELMRVTPQLSFLGAGFEATGEYCNGIRQAGVGILVQEIVRERSGRRRQTEYRLQGTQAAVFSQSESRFDPRTRPWYRTAARAGRPTWTETYLFELGPNPDSPGVSWTAPLTGRDGRLAGVVSADFTLAALSDFLKTIRVGERGFAFVVEQPGPGRHQVIAYPEVGRLLRRDGDRRRLVAAGELGDPRLARFLRAVERRSAGSPLPVGRGGGVETVRFTDGGVAYAGGYRRLSSPRDPPWLLCMIVPEADLMQRVARQSRWTLGFGSAAVLGVVLVGIWLSARAARWLTHLTDEAERIGRLELEPRPAPPTRVLEVDTLAVRMEQMKTGLRSFRKFVPAEVVRSLLASGQEAQPEGERRTLTLLFSDITGFTSISERLDPEELVALLSEYLDTLTTAIQVSGGTVDKYIGDGILAFWGAPAPCPGHARAACAAALRCQVLARELNAARQAAGKPPFHTRIGLNTGDVIVGTVGSPTRLNYTVLGDAVNVASRLEALNKVYGTEILISEATYQAAEGAVTARPLDRVTVAGRGEPVQVYELLGLREETPRSLAAGGA